jgi:hypothetical protein
VNQHCSAMMQSSSCASANPLPSNENGIHLSIHGEAITLQDKEINITQLGNHIKRGRCHQPSTRERRSRPGNAESFSLPPCKAHSKVSTGSFSPPTCKTHSKVSTLDPVPRPIRPGNFVTTGFAHTVRETLIFLKSKFHMRL